MHRLQTERMKLVLTKNLAKSLAQGHPWVYREALQLPKSVGLDRSKLQPSLAALFNSKSQLVAWGIYDSSSPLAFRLLTHGKVKPTIALFAERLHSASKIRQLLWRPNQTTGLRLVNGEGDQLPGLVVDLYADLAVVQFDGPGMRAFWTPYLNDLILAIATDWPHLTGAFIKPRSSEKVTLDSHPALIEINRAENVLQATSKPLIPVQIFENKMRFTVDCLNGQKTGFFLDQRDNRQYLSQLSTKKKVLNLFSYTGGFSVAAGVGGAQSVMSVDSSSEALKMASHNWQLNGLSDCHQTLCVDVFSWIHSTEAKNAGHWDSIIVDPPSLAKSERQKPEAKNKYLELFTWALSQLDQNGNAFFSSCSSHISSEDFMQIIGEALSQAKCQARIHRVSGQGMDHPYPAAASELRYLKFVHLSKSSN